MRKIRYGMVGGGPGAFIGAVHRAAAALDGETRLVAGAFSSDSERSASQGRALGLDPSRVYASYAEMAERERELAPESRIEFVSIVTPNHLHYPVARAFLRAGFHVVCDKPMTTTLEDAEALCRLVSETQRVFVLTHNYTGYPMVKEARDWARGGRLGDIRKVVSEYSQGWLSSLIEETGHKQAEWRQDPARAGISSAMGDIGSHAENLARYITGLRVERLIADVSSLVHGRSMEDDANLLLHFQGGARGVLYASQVSLGEENRLAIRVYGSEAALEWRQEMPNRLIIRRPDRPLEVLTRASGYLGDAARHASRLPPGHPEGFIEAFANLYRGAARRVRSVSEGGRPDPMDADLPTVQDGAIGVHLIHRAIESGRKGRWVDANYEPPA